MRLCCVVLCSITAWNPVSKIWDSLLGSKITNRDSRSNAHANWAKVSEESSHMLRRKIKFKECNLLAHIVGKNVKPTERNLQHSARVSFYIAPKILKTYLWLVEYQQNINILIRDCIGSVFLSMHPSFDYYLKEILSSKQLID